MTNPNSMAQRLRPAGIDEAACAALRQSKSDVLAVLPTVLEGFYGHIAQFNDAFAKPETLTKAKALQLRHWNVILEGKFDAAYEASVNEIASFHYGVKLTPDWLVGGHSVLIAGFLQALAPKSSGWFGGGNHEGRTALHKALAHTILLDLNMGLTVFRQANQKERRTTLDRLASDFESSIGAVTDKTAAAATRLQNVAREMNQTMEHTATQSTAVAMASNETSSNVQAVASASEELTASIAEISRRINDAAQVTQDANRSADDTLSKMTRLSDGVQKIGAIVDIIASVAGQTNLLALNATIEAARAGDAGRGFAVVAQEVKSLAEQTAKATSDIAAQIGGIQAATQESAASIGNITNVIKTLNEISTAVASAVEEQGAATNEIGRNVQEAARGTSEMSVSLDHVTQEVRATGKTAAHVSESATELSENLAQLHAEMARFLTSVRAA